MLTQAENELLTRVSNGAPMGRMLKQHCWVPAALSVKLVADGAPLRVQLLGERYVAFRATDGHVGFFDEACPHRGVSLALARNEDNALRCIYHGWKFAVDGRCIEVPTQVDDPAAFCARVPLNHYPVREAAGIVWVWLGGGENAPAFPEFEFTKVPEGQVSAAKQTGKFNWLQGVETTMDSAHLGVLHQSSVQGLGPLALAAENQAPVYEFDEQPYGYRYAAVRALANGTRYVRVNAFVLPWYGLVTPRQVPDVGGTAFFSIPNDDESTTYWTVPWRAHRLLDKDMYTMFEDPGNFPPGVPGGPEDNWGQNRALMKRGHFTGFPQHLTTEDFAVVVSQGAILDRSKEFLNPGDAGVVRLRRLLLKALHEFMEGEVPAMARNGAFSYAAIRPIGQILSADEDWRAAAG